MKSMSPPAKPPTSLTAPKATPKTDWIASKMERKTAKIELTIEPMRSEMPESADDMIA